MAMDDEKINEIPDENDDENESANGDENDGSQDTMSDIGLHNAERLSQNAFDKLRERAKFRRARNTTLIVCFAVAVCVIFAVACVSLFCKLSNVTVSGETRYNYEDIITASGLDMGQNLYSIDKAQITRDVIARYPYIGSVKVSRRIPDTILLTVSEEVPRYYFELCGEYFVLSESLRVLERTKVMASLLLNYPDMIKLRTQTIDYAVVGEPIVFENEGYYSYAQQMLSTFLNSNIHANITLIDFTNRFDIYVIYQDRIMIEFGSIDNIDVKLAFAVGIIEKLDLKDEGIVNVENVEGFYKISSIKGNY